jgi:hypothetical protein
MTTAQEGGLYRPSGGMRVFFVLLASMAAGCGSTGANLQAGVSTRADVERSMGTPAEVQKAGNGETTLWYPRHIAKSSYAARIAPDDKLIGVEQRLTLQNVGRIQPNRTTRAEVRALLGPPSRADQSARSQREIWTYPVSTPPEHKELYVQLSADGVVRESILVIDPEETKTR